MRFQPFQNLYSQVKETDQRLYEALDRISMYLQQLSDITTKLQRKDEQSLISDDVLIAQANVPLALTTAAQIIPNAFVLLNKQGTWLILGIFDFVCDNTSGSCQGTLEFNGLPFNPTDFAILSTSVGVIEGTIIKVWQIQNTGNSYAKLTANKSVNAGVSFAETRTQIVAIFVG